MPTGAGDADTGARQEREGHGDTGAPLEHDGDPGVTFSSSLTARDVFRVSGVVLLRHRLAVMAMAAGPVFWVVGVIGASQEVTRIGTEFLLVTAGVPVLALVTATWAAYRPGAGEIYVPVRWTFTDQGIGIEQPGRLAHAPWSDFRSWRRAADCFLLDVTRSGYLVLPVRDVPAGERPGLERLLSAKLGPRRR